MGNAEHCDLPEFSSDAQVDLSGTAGGSPRLRSRTLVFSLPSFSFLPSSLLPPPPFPPSFCPHWIPLFIMADANKPAVLIIGGLGVYSDFPASWKQG